MTRRNRQTLILWKEWNISNEQRVHPLCPSPWALSPSLSLSLLQVFSFVNRQKSQGPFGVGFDMGELETCVCVRVQCGGIEGVGVVVAERVR